MQAASSGIKEVPLEHLKSLLKSIKVPQASRFPRERVNHLSTLLLHSPARIPSALARGIRSLVLERALGVGAEVLEGVLALVLALLSAAGDALVVGVVGGGAGLGAGLARGVGGLAALVGGGHFFGGCCVVELWGWGVLEGGVRLVGWWWGES